MDHTKTVRDTILDYASSMGKATGFVTSEQLYGATPSGFTVHVENRLNSGSITQGQGTSGVDFLCGDRHDAHYKGKVPFLQEQGYFYSNTTDGLEEALTTAQKAYLTLDIESDVENCISLSDATSFALSFLSRDEDGFVLVIEQAKIDKGSHNMDIAAVTKSVSSLIETVETVMEWIGDRTDTAVLVTADHETGGLTVSGNPSVFVNTYDTGNGVISYRFVDNQHSDQQVKLFVYGREVNFKNFEFYASHHLIKNTDIYHIMKQFLDGGSA
jgi:alkaline phosphatase